MFLIVVKIWEPTVPPWSPCLLIVTDFKPFLEVPVTFLIVVKICESQGPTHGAPSRGLPLKIRSGTPAYLL